MMRFSSSADGSEREVFKLQLRIPEEVGDLRERLLKQKVANPKIDSDDSTLNKA